MWVCSDYVVQCGYARDYVVQCGYARDYVVQCGYAVIMWYSVGMQ